MFDSFFQDIQSTELKIQSVVIDNASMDDLEQSLVKKFPQVRCFINSKNLGFGTANNFALQKFEAKYYFLINPDIIFPKDQKITKKLFEFMEKYPKIGLVSPKLLHENNEVQPSCLRFPGFWDHPLYRLGLNKKYQWAEKRVSALLMNKFDHSKVLPIDWATGAAFFIRGDALRQVGFFDERFFMYFEDCDLCRRFWENGLPVYYKGDAFLIHGHERASARIPGFRSIFQNKLTRVHLYSLMKYWFKWRSNKL